MQNKGTIVRIVLVALMAYALLHFAAARAELEQNNARYIACKPDDIFGIAERINGALHSI